MSIRAGLAKNLADSLQTGHHSSYLMGGSGVIGIIRTEPGQGPYFQCDYSVTNFFNVHCVILSATYVPV